jgi:glycosyltransferase involved in cell wall biosynthesis
VSSPSSISVLIPAFDAERYLGEAIDSVLAQTLAPLELIVVDDGSEDGTAAVARSYGDRVVFESQARAGGSVARNRAVDLARGSYLAFLDADDRFTPRKLELQLAALEEEPELDMVFGHVREFVSPELPAEETVGLRPPKPSSPWVSPTLMLIRRASFDRVGGFRPELRVGQTVDWAARAIDAGLKSLMLPEVVLERRLHPRSTGTRELASRSQYIDVIRASMARRRAAS